MARRAEVEPKVVAEDVRAILARVIRPGAADDGDPVAVISERADVSTRTIYRVLNGDYDRLSLDLADRLVVAAESHLSECRIVLASGAIE